MLKLHSQVIVYKCIFPSQQRGMYVCVCNCVDDVSSYVADSSSDVLTFASSSFFSTRPCAPDILKTRRSLQTCENPMNHHHHHHHHTLSYLSFVDFRSGSDRSEKIVVQRVFENPGECKTARHAGLSSRLCGWLDTLVSKLSI